MKKRKTIKKEILTFNAVFLEEGDGGYSASVPALPGCFSQGDTFEEAMKNIKEAITLYLEGEREEKEWARSRPKKEFMAPVELRV
ncbi:MAG: type II toxin-antitoxin system HicB family antitoxin [Candidatus Sungiibacteriota bacterium]